MLSRMCLRHNLAFLPHGAGLEIVDAVTSFDFIRLRSIKSSCRIQTSDPRWLFRAGPRYRPRKPLPLHLDTTCSESRESLVVLLAGPLASQEEATETLRELSNCPVIWKEACMVFRRILIIHERPVELAREFRPPPLLNFPTKLRELHNICTLNFQCSMSMALRALESCESPTTRTMDFEEKLSHI